MPIESFQYFIILFRVNQVFTFYNFNHIMSLCGFTNLLRPQGVLGSKMKLGYFQKSRGEEQDEKALNYCSYGSYEFLRLAHHKISSSNQVHFA